MRQKKIKKRPPLPLRLLRALLLVAALIVLYSVIVGYIPFARTPVLEDISSLEARADEMMRDHDSPDRAVILETSLSALDERIRLIEQAQEEIIITTYDCRDDESVRDILCAALHKADEGVKVRFLVDGISGRLNLMPADLFRAVAAHPNVEIRLYNRLNQPTAWKHMGRMHDKYVIVDDLAYILGGRNTFDSFIGEYPASTYSRDREALVYNTAHGTDHSGESSLFELREYFEGMWAHPETSVYAAGRLSDGRRDDVWAELAARYDAIRAEKPALFAPMDYQSVTQETRGIWLIHNPTTIYAKQPVVFHQLCALMRRAKESIVIHSPYAVLNAMMIENLQAITAQVPVTLMINAVENGANVVASSDYLYHRGDVLSTGVTLLEYAGGTSYHGKSIAIDDEISIIGSFNLDLRSTYVDTELMLVIRGEAINAQLRENMNALHKDCLRVVDQDHVIAPEGLTLPLLSPWKGVALRALGAAMQLMRNLV